MTADARQTEIDQLRSAKDAAEHKAKVLEETLEAVNGSAARVAMALRAERDAAEQHIVTLTKNRDEWRACACDFHDSLVGKDMAGATNFVLQDRAVAKFDELQAIDQALAGQTPEG